MYAYRLEKKRRNIIQKRKKFGDSDKNFITRYNTDTRRISGIRLVPKNL